MDFAFLTLHALTPGHISIYSSFTVRGMALVKKQFVKVDYGKMENVLFSRVQI